MDFFIDSADYSQISEYSKLKLFKGITTTPTFFFRQNIMDYKKEIVKIRNKTNYEIHVEALGLCKNEIIENAKQNKLICDKIVSKVPIDMEGLKAVEELNALNIKTNVHLIFSVNQAILAAEAGADYICPLMGRINDIGGDSFKVLEEIVKVIHGYKYKTKVMASSIRTAEDVKKSLLIGVDAITIPPRIIDLMFYHPLTDNAVKIFKKDIALSKMVADIMKKDEELPLINENARLQDALVIMTRKNNGFAIIINTDKTIEGVLTDGDIRRVLQTAENAMDKPVSMIMNRNPIIVDNKISTARAIQIMEEKRITDLVVSNGDRKPMGYICLHDIMSSCY